MSMHERQAQVIALSAQIRALIAQREKTLDAPSQAALQAQIDRLRAELAALS